MGFGALTLPSREIFKWYWSMEQRPGANAMVRSKHRVNTRTFIAEGEVALIVIESLKPGSLTQRK